jgi:2-methylcitrate dehydratase PrpD
MNTPLLTVLQWLNDTDLSDHPHVRQHARHLVLDTLGCAIAGHRASEVSQFEKQAALADPGTFYFSKQTSLGVTQSNAAMLLAMAICWDEACEGHAGAHGRPGVAVMAALLPLSAKLSYGQFLKSLVVGYEVGARYGASLRINKGMHVDGNWPALGAAAAVAHAMGLSPEQIVQAVMVAACQMPMSLYLPITSGATSRNTYLGHAAQLGQSAALAVASGITAPVLAAENYSQVAMGKEALPLDTRPEFQILQAYFKPYAAVRHVHYGALAANTLRPAIDVQQIQKITLYVYEEATIYCGNRAPQTPLQAQFSLSFGVAAMLRWGRLDPWVYREPQFHDASMRHLESLIEIAIEPNWTQQQRRAARLRIDCQNGTVHEHEVTAVPGDLTMPFPEDALLAKFMSYGEGSLSPTESAHWAHQLLNGSLDANPFPFWK